MSTISSITTKLIYMLVLIIPLSPVLVNVNQYLGGVKDALNVVVFLFLAIMTAKFMYAKYKGCIKFHVVGNNISIFYAFVIFTYFSLHIVSYAGFFNALDGFRHQLIYMFIFSLLLLNKNEFSALKLMFVSKVLILIITVSVAIGLYEFFDDNVIEFIYGTNKADMENVKLAIGFRLISLFSNPINYGAFLCLFAPVGYFYFEKNKVNFMWFWLLCIPISFCIFFTLSRLALLCWLIALLYVVILRLNEKFLSTLLFFLIPLLFSLSFVYVASEFSLDSLDKYDRMLSIVSVDTLTENSRINSWMNALSYTDNIIYILWGLGLGVSKPGVDLNTIPVENSYVSFYIEFGFLGLFFYFFVLINYLINIKNLKRLNDCSYKFHLLFLMIFCVMSMGNDFNKNYPFSFLFWLFFYFSFSYRDSIFSGNNKK